MAKLLIVCALALAVAAVASAQSPPSRLPFGAPAFGGPAGPGGFGFGGPMGPQGAQDFAQMPQQAMSMIRDFLDNLMQGRFIPLDPSQMFQNFQNQTNDPEMFQNFQNSQNQTDDSDMSAPEPVTEVPTRRPGTYAP